MYTNHLELIASEPTVSSENRIESKIVDVHLDKTRSFESSVSFLEHFRMFGMCSMHVAQNAHRNAHHYDDLLCNKILLFVQSEIKL